MKALLIGIFFLQAFLILTDEFYCHWRRQLPNWERWGHPLDTFFLLLPLSLLILVPGLSVYLYAGLAVFSCLLITKDEWVHVIRCSAFEKWLHALLFMIHPAVFVLAWIVKQRLGLPAWILLPITGFLIYQLIYWNVYEPNSFRIRPQNRKQ
jgi:hypothetical protein